jgi:hypothetical protein
MVIRLLLVMTCNPNFMLKSGGGGGKEVFIFYSSQYIVHLLNIIQITNWLTINKHWFILCLIE